MGMTKEMTLNADLDRMLKDHPQALLNQTRRQMISGALEDREAISAACGALVTWTPPHSTGRSPKDTLLVRGGASEAQIDWDSPNCIPLDAETFDMLWEDALERMATKEKLYVTNRVAGADSAYALPIRTVTDRALHALFTENMFRDVPQDLEPHRHRQVGE